MNVVPRPWQMLLGPGLVGLGLLSFAPAALANSGPSLSFAPSSWTAGPIDSGTTTSLTFTLMNSGGRASGAITVTVSGSAAFSIPSGDDGCTGRSLGPNKSCSVTVQYAPISSGESDTATLSADGVHASTSASLHGSSNPKFAKSARDCAALGGTFSTDPATDLFHIGAAFLWTCNNGPRVDFDVSLFGDCLADAGGAGGMDFAASPPFDSTCFKIL